ncbi:putative ribonuclease H-like domain-containing protein [Tanacetum coccineum]
MSANDKFGLGYEDHRYDGILSYENEMLQSVFMSKESELENQHLYDRFVTTEEMHAVPPPMIGNYMPSGLDVEIDDSKFTYGPKQTQPSEILNQNQVNLIPMILTLRAEPSVLVSEPVENVKNQSTHSQKPKVDKKDLGYGFAVRACFVCGSLNHLIRDCDFHEKRMARKAELNNGLNNVQRVNKQNQFVPSAVLTRTGIIPVNTARTSGTKIFSTARQSVNRQTVLTSTAMKVNTVKHIVNRVRPANVFNKTHSSSTRPFKKTTVLRPKFSNQKFNTAKDLSTRALKNKGLLIVVVLATELGTRPTLMNFKTLMVALLLLENGKQRKASCKAKQLSRTIESKVKTIRSDNGTEFKNKDVIEFCGSKGIKREYNSFLPNTFWAEAVSTACYVLNRGHMKFAGKSDEGFLVGSENQANLHAGQQEANQNAEILKKFDFANVKTASTPIETQKPLVKDEEASDVDVHLYRSMIGSLMYLTASRPDIMFAVCACSRFQVTPKSSHLSAVKRIFRYLKGKPKLGLWYPRVSSFDLESYSDSDYAGANLDRKSTTGGCQFLGRRLISWQCKKQTIVATSTTEAEYVAAASCCGQVLWIQNQMLDYGFNFMNTKIYIDNESTICIVKNPVYHSKTKHIAIRHHFIRDAYEKKLIQVLKIHTDDNVADLLTKAFDVSRGLIGFRESLRRVIDGTEALLLPTLFILWLDKVSTDSAKLVPLGKVCIAIETLKKNTAKALISLLTTITLSTTMAVLDSCPKHNMVAYLEKTEGNAEFHEIIDFLTRSSIYHALTVSPVVSTIFVEQFWTSAKSKIINNVRHITTIVAGKPVSISELSIRSGLLFNDANEIDSLPNQAIFDAIRSTGSSEAQPTPSPPHSSYAPFEPQTDPSPPHSSEAPCEPQTDPSPRPSPSTIIPDSIPESSGGNLGDSLDYIETEDAQDMGRTRDVVDEEKENAEDVLSTEDVLSAEDVLSTAQQKVSTDKEKVSTDKEKVSTDKPIVSTNGSKS